VLDGHLHHPEAIDGNAAHFLIDKIIQSRDNEQFDLEPIRLVVRSATSALLPHPTNTPHTAGLWST
jgi:hypothetical protein